MRKTAWICTAYLCSLSVGLYLGTDMGFVATILAALASAFLLARKKPYLFTLILAISLIVGTATAALCNDAVLEVSEYGGMTVSLSGRIEEIRSESESSYRVTLKADTVNGKKAGRYFGIRCDIPKTYAYCEVGSYVIADAELYEISNSPDFPTKSYELGKLCPLSAKLSNLRVFKGGFSIDGAFYKINRWLKGVYDSNLNYQSAALAKGIVLGDDSQIAYSTMEGLRAGGVSHILSVSGFHISIIIWAVSFLLDGFGARRSAKIVTVILCAVFYLFITGFVASMTRSVIMCVFANLGYFTKKRSDPITSLFLTAAIMCFFEPLTVYDLSFQLSFFATLGIVFTSMYIVADLGEDYPKQAVKKFMLWVASVFVMSVGATVFCLPVTAVYFKGASVLSPLGNLICAPISEWLLVAACLLVVALPLPPVAMLCARVCEMLSSLLCESAELFASAKLYFTLEAPACVAFCVLVLLFITFVMLTGIKKKTRILSAALFAVFLISTVASLM